MPLGDTIPYDSLNPCFVIPIEIEYVTKEDVLPILDDDDNLLGWDTIYSVPQRFSDDLNFCYCEEAYFGGNEGATSRISPSTTVNLEVNVKDLTIFPNPVTEEMSLTYQLPQASQVMIQIINLNGQIVKMVMPNTQQTTGFYRQEINLSDLQPGIYTVNIVSNTKTQFKKIVKK